MVPFFRIVLVLLLFASLAGCASSQDGAPTTVVEIEADGTLLVSGSPVSLEFLPGAVAPGKIIIDADPEVPLERVDNVLDHLRSNGFRNVAFLPAQT